MKQYFTEDELKNLYNVDIKKLRYRQEHGLIPAQYMKVFRTMGTKYEVFEVLFRSDVLKYVDGTYSASELRKQQRIRLLMDEGILSQWTNPATDYILLNEAAKQLGYCVSSLLYRFGRYPHLYNQYILTFENNTYIDATLISDWDKLEEAIRKEKYQLYKVCLEK